MLNFFMTMGSGSSPDPNIYYRTFFSMLNFFMTMGSGSSPDPNIYYRTFSPWRYFLIPGFAHNPRRRSPPPPKSSPGAGGGIGSAGAITQLPAFGSRRNGCGGCQQNGQAEKKRAGAQPGNHPPGFGAAGELSHHSVFCGEGDRPGRPGPLHPGCSGKALNTKLPLSELPARAFLLLVWPGKGQVYLGGGALVIPEAHLAVVGFGDLLNQGKAQNVGRVFEGFALERLEHLGRIAAAGVLNQQVQLRIIGPGSKGYVAALGIVPLGI